MRIKSAFLKSVLLCFLLTAHAVEASTWVKRVSEAARGTGVSVITADGGIVVAANYNSYGLCSAGAWPTLIYKLSSDGVLEWHRVICRNFSTLSKIDHYKGGYILGGTVYVDTESYIGLLTLDSGGGVKGLRVYGVGTEYLDSFVITSRNEIAVSGQSGSIPKHVGAMTGFLLKIGEGGEYLWSKGYYDTVSNIHLREHVEGGFLAVASSHGGDFLWIARLDDFGRIVQQKQYFYDGSMTIRSFKETSDGGAVFIADPRVLGEHEFVAKLDKDGNIEWQRGVNADQTTQEQLDGIYDVIQTNDGKYALTGSTSGPDTDMVILKFDPHGTVEWQKRYSYMAHSEQGRALHQSDEGDYYAVSRSSVENSRHEFVWKVNGDGEINSCAEGLIQETNVSLFGSIKEPVNGSSSLLATPVFGGADIESNEVDVGVSSNFICDASYPMISVVPHNVDFGSVVLGHSKQSEVTVANVGTEPLAIYSIDLVDDSSASFFQENNCTLLGVSEACTINAGFAPATLGALFSKIEIFSNDNLSPQVDVMLQGQGLDSSPPGVELSVSPDTLWPPNGKVVEVQISGRAWDEELGIASINIRLRDEYNQISFDDLKFGDTVQLPSWREESDIGGRVYMVTVVVANHAGQEIEETATITVPHDMRSRSNLGR